MANPPQTIEQEDLTPDYVNKKKVEAETALRKGKAGTRISTIDGYPLYHYRLGRISGIWFISQDGKTVDYLYAYQGVNLKSPVGQKASEALAYLNHLDCALGDIGLQSSCPSWA